MSVRLQYLREAWSFLKTFTGRLGEVTVDTTNNRLIVHDGSTAGGFPTARADQVAPLGRTPVADANYTAALADVNVAYTALTAPRTVTLPLTTAYPVGRVLTALDETGACSITTTITLAASGSEMINGASSVTIGAPYGALGVMSNGAGKWILVDQAVTALQLIRLGIGTTADATNRLTVKSEAALFSWDDVTPGAGNMRATLNKKAAANDAGFVFQTGFSTRALFGTLGADDFVLKVSPDGSAFYTPFQVARSTGVLSFNVSPTAPTAGTKDNSSKVATTAYVDAGSTRSQVSDANYTILATDRTVVVISLSAARTLTLPAASAYPQGVTLTVFDESGTCSWTNSVSIVRAGFDTLSGLTAFQLVRAYGFVAFQSNGSNKWTVVDRDTLTLRSTFVDVLKNDGNQQAIGAAFTRLVFASVNQNTGGCWDSANNLYACPRSGIYQIAGSLRVADGTAAGTQYGIGVYGTESDGPWFLWNDVGPGPATRSTFAYSRLSYQNAGDQLRMFSYSDASGGVKVASAGLQIMLVSDAA